MEQHRHDRTQVGRLLFMVADRPDLQHAVMRLPRKVASPTAPDAQAPEDQKVVVKRCINPVSAEAFDIFSHGRDAECCGNSWCDLAGDYCGFSDCGSVALSGVVVVTDVPVSPSSAVAVMSEASLSDSDWEFVEPQSFSFSKKRSAACWENSGNMSYEGTPVKAPPATRRKIMPSAPQQSLHSSIEAMQWQTEVEDQESCSYGKELDNIGGMLVIELFSRRWSSN